MAKLKVYNEIVDSDTKVWLSWDGFESVSSDDIVKFIEDIPEDDNEIRLHIHCPGGMVWEGWRMYDALRQSGKEISVVVEGLCASMATVLMLAAPKERRYAYPNATFLIHNPAVDWISLYGGDRLTAENVDAMSDKLKAQADQLRAEQERIMNTYVERTGSSADVLQPLMDAETIFGTDKAIELGFITETLAPNTASVSKHPILNMKENVEVKKNILDRMLAKLGFSSVEDVKFNDLSFTSANGDTFAVEREEGVYAVGDKATPDGQYVMEDGSTVCIADGVINDIVAPKAELKNPENGETITEEEAQNLLNNQSAKIKELETQLEEAKNKTTEDSANIEQMTARIGEMNAEIEEKNASIASLEGKVVTDEQNEILNIVAEAGGKAWLDALGNKKSDGAPNVVAEEAPVRTSFLEDRAKNSRRFR